MTKDGKYNEYGKFIFTREQAERVAAGDMSAAWEFLEDNRKFLTCWARKFWRNHYQFIPKDIHGYFYKAEELINQIAVDFAFYRMEDEESLLRSISRSFRGFTCGGYCGRNARGCGELSLDAPLTVSQRSGDTEAGDALKDILPSGYPPPDIILERAETVRELAPRYFHEIGKLFQSERESGATIGEMLAAQNGEATATASPFQDVIEEVFFGYTFEEVKHYAIRTA